MPSLASNSNISDMFSTRNMSTEEEVDSCICTRYIQLEINCTSCNLARALWFVIKRLILE